MCFNINKMFFLKFGIESIMRNSKLEITYHNKLSTFPDLYRHFSHLKYVYLEFPISFGYNITNISEDITLYCSLGGKFSLMNNYYYHMQNELRNSDIKTYEKRTSAKEFFSNFDSYFLPIFASIGLEKDIKNASAGVSLFFQSRDIGSALSIFHYPNHQIGLTFEFKF